MTDYVMETKIELIKSLTEIEIKLKFLNMKINSQYGLFDRDIVFDSDDYLKLKQLRKQRDKLNAALNSMEVDNV